MGKIRVIIKPAKWHTNRPIWVDENSDVVETAMIDPQSGGAEYREGEGQQAGQQGIKEGSRAAGAEDSNPQAAADGEMGSSRRG